MATVTEIAEGVYRINVVIPGKRVTYSLFLIDDHEPTLIETSFGRVFDEVKEAVAKVLDPREIRHIVVPHFEGDECGALNKFLDIAPDAMPVCSPIGANSVGDFTGLDPRTVADGEVLSIGARKLRFLLTPYVHLWDSLLIYEETQRVLYSSDLFGQPGMVAVLGRNHDAALAVEGLLLSRVDIVGQQNVKDLGGILTVGRVGLVEDAAGGLGPLADGIDVYIGKVGPR